MKDKTTCQNLCEKLQHVKVMLGLDYIRLSGNMTNGAPSMTGEKGRMMA